MKKSVSILVSAISLLAIIFVAIFGTQPQGIIPIIYVSSIKIKPANIEEDKYTSGPTGNICVISYDSNKEVFDGDSYYMPYLFTTEILPKDATNQKFLYYFDENSLKQFIEFSPIAGAANKGAFLIKRREDIKRTGFDLKVRSLDGKASDTLTVVLNYRSIYKGE